MSHNPLVRVVRAWFGIGGAKVMRLHLRLGQHNANSAVKVSVYHPFHTTTKSVRNAKSQKLPALVMNHCGISYLSVVGKTNHRFALYKTLWSSNARICFAFQSLKPYFRFALIVYLVSLRLNGSHACFVWFCLFYDNWCWNMHCKKWKFRKLWVRDVLEVW